jgi:ADP-ribose pyrophosphatase YjhB (NUDIX family)
MNYCTHCGGALQLEVPAGDDRPRHCCQACGLVHYRNPKMVVGCIPEWKDRILLCLRAIEPRAGMWTLPAGFLENNETVSEGARREVLEETHADVRDLQPYGLYNIPHISQIYFFFRARLENKSFAPTHESREVRLFRETEVPWDQLAFPVVEKALKRYFKDRRNASYPFHIDIITRRIHPAS